ncbi:MAG: hypothetical protein GX660_22380 [Clostridiaceae bacterium]|jgi:hypothetical protein|nr:hypothetical protein [Clostridiaceae bacterium]
MFCVKCQRHIAYCKCEDVNSRLACLGKSELVKDLALGAIEQRNEQKISKHMQDIEFMHENSDKTLKISFESKRHDGIYQVIGKVVDITPAYTRLIEAETNYPGGAIEYLNTSRIVNVEVHR